MNAEQVEKRVGQIYREKIGADLQNGIKGSSNVFLISYSKLSSMQLSEFRKDLEKAGASAYVLKNRIAQLTLRDLGHEKLAERVSDQTAFVWSNEDSVTISKILMNFAKDLEEVKVKGGILDDRLLEAADVQRLSDLPSKQTLQAMLLGTLQAPLVRLAGALNAKSRELLSILKQYGDQKGGN